LPKLTVADLMSRRVLCVRPHLSLDAVMQLFVESRLEAAPVVNERREILGIVTESDVELDIHARAGVRDAVPTVADVMMPVPCTLAEDTPVTRAAAIMVQEGVSQLVVTSLVGAVVGLLSSADVLYWLARADGFVLPPPHPADGRDGGPSLTGSLACGCGARSHWGHHERQGTGTDRR
jgi:predicted transcriptional regulator